MMPLLAGTFVAGLVGSPHCVGMCGAFAASCGDRAASTLPWHLGRIVTYSTLGALAGSVGWVVPGPAWVGAALSLALVVYFAAALAGFVAEPRFRIPGATAWASRAAGARGWWGRFVFGVANGLLPCGLVYAALGAAVAAAEPWAGASAMALFGLGTVPALTAVTFGLRSLIGRHRGLRRGMALAVLMAGLWSIGARMGWQAGGPDPRAEDTQTHEAGSHSRGTP